MSDPEYNAARRAEGLRAVAQGLNINLDLEVAIVCLNHAADKIEELERERDEQCRLLGMSAERECDLRGMLDRERALADRLALQLKPLLIATWREKSPSKAELAMEAWEEARK